MEKIPTALSFVYEMAILHQGKDQPQHQPHNILHCSTLLTTPRKGVSVSSATDMELTEPFV